MPKTLLHLIVNLMTLARKMKNYIAFLMVFSADNEAYLTG